MSAWRRLSRSGLWRRAPALVVATAIAASAVACGHVPSPSAQSPSTDPPSFSPKPLSSVLSTAPIGVSAPEAHRAIGAAFERFPETARAIFDGSTRLTVFEVATDPACASVRSRASYDKYGSACLASYQALWQAYLDTGDAVFMSAAGALLSSMRGVLPASLASRLEEDIKALSLYLEGRRGRV